MGYGNYSSIQNAINISESGDVIIVYNGTYWENIILDKSVDLIGINRYDTIVNGNNVDDVVLISASNASICNFTIKNSGTSNSGIKICSDYNVICGNIIEENGWSGITTGNPCRNSVIRRNHIRDNGYGVFFNDESLNINFSKNAVCNNTLDGVYLDRSSYGTIFDNTIENNGDDGIGLSYCYDVNIYNNLIRNNTDNGLYLYSCKTKIIGNNIMDNIVNGVFLRNSNNSDIRWNDLKGNINGIELTFFSSNNKIRENKINNSVIGIKISLDAGTNQFYNNSFSNNDNDIVQEEQRTSGFEIILILFSVLFFSFWKRRSYKI